MRALIVIFAGMVLGLSAMFAAPTVYAAETPVPETQVLHIDEGFLGHTVTLDLFEGTVRIWWDAGDVLAPGELRVTRTSSTEIDIEWSSSYVLGPRGIAVGFAQSSSSLAHSTATVQSKIPFDVWREQKTSLDRGYVFARIGAEGRVQLTLVPRGMRAGTATWYKYKSCDCAASPDFAKGTELKVWLADAPETFTVVRVNDYGPDRNLFPERVIDLDAVAFKKLAPLSRGVVRVMIEPL